MADSSGKNEGLTEFEALADQLRKEIRTVLAENRRLDSENQKLRQEISNLKKAGEKMEATFADLPEKQRILMKQQIESLMEKIDGHLGGDA